MKSCLLSLLIVSAPALFAGPTYHKLVLKAQGDNTTLLKLSGKNGDRLVNLLLEKGNVTLTTVFGKDHDEDPGILVTAGNSISVECHAIRATAVSGEVVGYYYIEDIADSGKKPSEAEVAAAALKQKVADKAGAYVKAAAASIAAAKAAAESPGDPAKAAAAAAAAAIATKAKGEYEDARLAFDAA